MRKILLVIMFCIWVNMGFSQINSGNPAIPFGSNTSYSYGSMPNNLPTSGTYGISQAAADAYNAWKSNLTETCTNGVRVKYDTKSETVSEGIGYGMLLSAYAGDKALFDNLYKFYKANANSNGLMNWHTSGCSGIIGYNGATDADEDAAMALIIASKQWPSATSPYNYLTEATSLIGKIRQYEIHPSTYQAVNGDAWGFDNSCRNPSYFAPAYYREFAKIETSYASVWNNAVSTANTFLSTNRNYTTGLVCNWADNTGASNNCNGNKEFGFDAIRNPWRMATDVIWNGSTTATTASDICTKMASWMNGYESNLKIPCAMNASNPSAGSYKNGTAYMMSLAMMGVNGKASNLATAYNNTVGLGSNEAYFSQTLRCITLFMMTGNFWKPSTVQVTNPSLMSAATNATGTAIILQFNKEMANPASSEYSSFVFKKNGVSVSNAFSAISSSSNTITLSLKSPVVANSVLTISYTQGTIKSSDNFSLSSFTNQSVTNNVSAGNTLIADCEDAQMTKLLTAWYSYADKTTTITPVSSSTTPFKMTKGGANNTDSAAIANGFLAKPASPDYESAGIGFTFKNPEADYDLTGATGFSFWHKGDAVNFSVMLSTVTPDKGYDYSYAISEHTNWTLIEVKFSDLSQPGWMSSAAPSELKSWDASKIYKIQWQVKDGSARNYSFGIDEVSVMGKILNLPQATVDKAILIAALSSANALYANSIEGTANGQYPVGSKTTLLSAINSASSVNSNSVSTQAQVDAAVTALNTAVSNFERSIIVVSKTVLASTIANAQSIYNNSTEGTADGQYPVGSKTTLQNAINAATSVNSNSSVSQTQVNAAVTTLNNAISDFQNSVYGVNKSALATSINNAQNFSDNESDNLGNKPGNYPQSAWDNLNSIINSAKIILNNQNATQAQVDLSKNSVDDAISAFISSVIPEVLVTSLSISSVGSVSEITTKGGTLQLNASVTPTNASNKNVEWTSSNMSIATVNTEGLVTAKADGNVIIKAIAKDGSEVESSFNLSVSNQNTIPSIINEVKGTFTQSGNSLIFKGRAVIINILGQVVESGMNTIDTSTLTSGIYYVIIEGVTKRLLIK